MVARPLRVCTLDASYAAPPPPYGPIIEQKNNRYFVRRVEYILYPNSIQTKMLESHLGLCHRLYNMMLKTSLLDLANGLPKKSVFGLNRGVKEISDADPELKGELYSTCHHDTSSRIH